MSDKMRAADGANDRAETSRTSCPVEVTCPQCGFVAPVTVVRCPRCNALVIAACGGACASCGSRGCLLPGGE